jgi:hypothetical protein
VPVAAVAETTPSLFTAQQPVEEASAQAGRVARQVDPRDWHRLRKRNRLLKGLETQRRIDKTCTKGR